MRVNRASRATLLLMEVMVSVLLFALAGAVCVRILTRAQALSDQAQSLRRADLAVSNAAELLRSGRREIPGENEGLRLTFRQENNLTVCYIEWYEDETRVLTRRIVLPPEGVAP